MSKKAKKPQPQAPKPGGNRTAGTVPLYVDLPLDLAAEVRRLMSESGRTKKEVVLDALRHWLDQERRANSLPECANCRNTGMAADPDPDGDVGDGLIPCPFCDRSESARS